jgi:hypothetical protein
MGYLPLAYQPTLLQYIIAVSTLIAKAAVLKTAAVVPVG